MITLKTLAQATDQEVFDQIVNHLLTQNKRAVKEGTNICKYRGDDGTKCAAGCLIADDEYQPEMEGNGWVLGFLVKFDIPREHKDLILNIQIIHDQVDATKWEEELKEFAQKNHLEFNYIKH